MSVKTARTIVKTQVNKASNKARRALERYKDGYVQTVRKALTESQHGEEERCRRLAEVESGFKKLTELRSALNNCVEFLEESK